MIKGVKEVRPTTGKTLAALMSILGPLSDCRFLDAFSGTGRVAAEARRRGARVVTVETLPDRAAAIRRGLGEENHLCLAMDVRRALGWLSKRDWVFDVVFADPPYDLRWGRDWPALLAQHRGLLAPGGLAVMEHSGGDQPVMPPGWRIVDSRRYGLSHLTFFVPEEDPS